MVLFGSLLTLSVIGKGFLKDLWRLGRAQATTNGHQPGAAVSFAQPAPGPAR